MKDSSPQNTPSDPLVVQFNLMICAAKEAGDTRDKKIRKKLDRLFTESSRPAPGASPRMPANETDSSSPAASRNPTPEGSLDRDRLRNLLHERQAQDNAKAKAGEPDIEISLVLYV